MSGGRSRRAVDAWRQRLDAGEALSRAAGALREQAGRSDSIGHSARLLLGAVHQSATTLGEVLTKVASQTAPAEPDAPVVTVVTPRPAASRRRAPGTPPPSDPASRPAAATRPPAPRRRRGTPD